MGSESENDWGKLMTLAQQGDSASYNLLLNELAPYIRRFCNKKVSYLNIAEDVVQEALLALHKYRHTYDGTKPFKPWLHTIVKCKAIDALKSRHKIMANEIQNEDCLTQMLAPDGGVGDVRDVQELLKRIPEDFRKPIEMMKLQSLSVQDIAQKLNLQPSTVKMRVHRGLKLLKEIAEGNIYE